MMAVVNVEAIDSSASESGDPGAFLVTLDAPDAMPLWINYTLSGTATNGEDYDTLSGSVEIPMGETSVTIAVAPLSDGLSESDETVVLTLEEDINFYYELGSSVSATVTISDAEGGFSVNAGGDASVNEGASFGPSFSFSDPDGESWTASVNFGDGSPPASLPLSAEGAFSLSHVYSDDGLYTVTVTVTSQDNRTASDSLDVTVHNVTPTINAGSGFKVAAGTAWSRGGLFADPGADTWTATVDYGDGSGPQTLELSSDKTFTLAHTYANSGTYNVLVAVTDDDGGVGAEALTVTVNTPPSVDLDADDSSGALGSGYITTFIEDAGSVLIADVDALLADVDDEQLAGLTVKLTNRRSPEEVITADTTGTPISASYAHGVLRLTGSAPLAQYEQVLRTLSYNNTADAMLGGDRLITVVADDGFSKSEPASITVSVQLVNDAPIAASGDLVIGQDTYTQFELGSDGDGEVAQRLTLAIISPPAHGTLGGFDPLTGTIWFSPEPGFTGADSFSYYLTDDDQAGAPAALSSATVTRAVTIQRLNSFPEGHAQEVATTEDTPLALTLSGDDGEQDLVQTLSYSIVAPPAHGTLSNFDPATGAVTYTPDPNYVGDDSFSFAVTDDATVGGPALTSDPAAIAISVAAVNDAPVAVAQTVGIGKDTATSIGLGHDGDPEVGQSLTLTVVSGPAHGSLSNFDPATGQVTYTPAAGYQGNDSFSFTLTDEGGLTSAEAVVTLDVAAAPTAGALSGSTAEDTPLALTLTGDDGDATASYVLTYSIVAEPSQGTLSGLDPLMGQLTYQPAANYHGSDSFTYRVSYTTPGGAVVHSPPATVNLSVSAVNDAPLENVLELTIGKDEATVVTLGDDGDPEVVQQLTLTVITAPSYGTLSGFDPATGAVVYTPAAGYIGPDSFTFTLTDDATAGAPAALTSGTGEVSFIVRARPVAEVQALTLGEDTELAVSLTAVAGELEATRTFEIIAQPSHGTLSNFNPATGAVTYTPDANYHGPDSFRFIVREKGTAEGSVDLASAPATISLTVTAANDQPAGGAQEVSLTQGGSVDLVLTGDDRDPEVEQTLSYALGALPTHGTIQDFNPATGELRYIPDPNYYGPDSLTFTVTDDATAGGAALTSQEVTISITIGAPPVADDQSVTMAEDTALTIVLTGLDGDASSPAALKYLIVTAPQHGTIVSFDPLTGQATYQPDPDYVGTDSFEFALVDDLAAPGLAVVGAAATVSITVTAVNDAPVAHTQDIAAAEGNAAFFNLGHDGDAEAAQNLTLTIISGPAHGVLSGFHPATGQVTYTPAAGYTGADSFTFTLSDDGTPALTSAAASVSITVATVNHAPTADGQSVTVSEDTPLSLTLTGDDGDAGANQVLRFEIVSPPAHGVISGFDPATGTLTYTPDADYNGPDSFRFVVLDDGTIAGGGELVSEAATVTIAVTAVNDAPTAETLSFTVVEDQPAHLQFVGDDGDPSQDQALTYVLVTLPAWGTISDFDAATGRFTYTPNANYSGGDSFSYSVTDDAAAGGPALSSATQSVTLTVAAAHHSVIAMPLAVATDAGVAMEFTLSTIGGGGAAIGVTFAIDDGPDHGTLSGLDPATGEVLYTPDAGYTGPDTFTFSVTDSRSGQTTTAAARIDVAATSALPAAGDDELTVRASDGQIVLDVLANDTHSAGGSLTIVSFTTPASGTLTLVPGTPGAEGPAGRDRLQYTPAAGQTGVQSFTYTVENGAGQQSTASVDVTVAADGTVASDGSLAIGGSGFNADPDSSFVRPVTGNVQTTRTATNLLARNWTDSSGEVRNGTGTQTNTVTVTATEFPSGDWTYVEVGIWSYDVWAGDIHAWGGYNYTFTAGVIAGAEFFFFVLNTDDYYSATTTLDDGTAESGSTTTNNSGGHRHQWLFKSKVTNVAGTLAVAQLTTTGDSNYSTSRNYWYATPGGSVTGAGSGNGSTFDFLQMSVTWSIPAVGPQVVTGTTMGMGFGNNGFNYSGSGTYVQDVISGSITEGGSNGSRYNYSLNGTLQPNLEWSLTGSGSQSGSGISNVSHSGSGTKTTTGSDSNGDWTLTSDLTQGGSQQNAFRSSMNLSLTPTGWIATGGSASATGNASGYSTHSGSGSYSKSSTSPTEYWSISGTHRENGGERQASAQTTISTYDGTSWTTVGSGTGSGSSSNFRSFSGSGTYTQAVLNASGAVTGSISGNRWEDGSSRKSTSQQTVSALVGGAWVTAGTASGSSEVRGHGSYSGSGSYVFQKITRNAWQSGSEDSQTGNESHWTMAPGGSWTLSSGSGATSQKSDNSGSYSGSGTYTESTSSGMSGATGGPGSDSGGGTSWSNNNITRWDAGGEESHMQSTSQMQVIGGEWKITSGSGSGSGKSSSSSSYSASGSYGYTAPNISVTGSHSGAGGNSLNTQYTLTSTYDPAAQSGTGDWITSGNSSGSNASSSRSDSSGSGTWNLAVNTAYGNTTGSGTVTEDNHSHQAGSSDWTATRAAGSEEWELTGGSGSASGGSSNNWSLSASGSYFSVNPDTWGSFTLESERHNSDEFNVSNAVIGGEWKSVSGSSSASGSTHDMNSRSGTGSFNREGKWTSYLYQTVHSASETKDTSYQVNSTVGADHQWHSTGSATGSASGSNYSSAFITNAKYQRQIFGGAGTINGTFKDGEVALDYYSFTSHFTLNASGSWVLTSGSGSSYDGQGIGQAFSGSGGYSLAGLALYEDGTFGTWSVNGSITEGGGWDVTEGTGVTYGVSGGSWVVLSKSGSGTSHDYESFSNSASGSYARGSISGTFSRSEKDSADAFFTFSMSGSGEAAVPWSGSGSSHASSEYQWSYSGAGAYSTRGTTGNLQESGSGGSGWTEDLEFERSGSGNWIQTGGTEHQSGSGKTAVHYSGTASYTDGATSLNGSSWSVNGTRTLTIDEESSFNDTDDYEFQNGAMEQTAASYWQNDKSQWRDEYTDSGTYVEVFGAGTISGTLSSSGFNEAESDIEETTILASGKWTRTGDGTGQSKRESHSSYSGNGNYAWGGINGTIQQDGQHHSSGEGNFEYRLNKGVWQIKGEGTSQASGEDNYSFTGSGTYSSAIPGGTLAGTQSESGGANYDYDYTAEWKLGVGQQWVLVSGSGHSAGSGQYHYSSSGSGSYTKTFDGDGALSGNYSASAGEDWEFDFRYDSQVVNRAWSTTGSGSESGSSFSNFSYSGSGSRSHTTTTPNGSSQDDSSLSEAVGGGTSNEYTFDWNEDADGLTWNFDSTSTSSGSGMYDYSASGNHSYTYSDGDYAGGNGSISSSSGSYQRSDNESYGWESTTNYHEEYADGEITSWSDSTGSGSGTGQAYRFDDGDWSSQSRVTSPGYFREESHASGSGSQATDNYDFTANWSHSIAADGAEVYNATVSNDVSGSGESWWSYSEAWTETTSSSGTGSGGGGSSTTSGGSNGSGSSPLPGYSETVDYTGFYTGAYNQPAYGWGIGGVPVSGSYSYSIPGDPGGGGSSGGGGGGGGGSTPPDLLAGGPWFDIVGGGDDPVDEILLVGLEGILHQGAGGAASFDEILAFSEPIPDNSSPYGGATSEWIGENIIRPVVGDENLIGASDFELFLGTAIFSTVLVVGLWFVLPAGVAAGAGIGFLAGAGIGVAYGIAHQLDNGGSIFDLNLAQVADAGLAGGLTGALMGGAFGAAAAAIPGFCTFAQVLGAGMSAYSLYNAYNNFNDGNYYTATVDALLGVTGLYGAAKGMFGKASQALGGSCFVAGTPVVLYLETPAEPLAAAEAAPAAAGWNLPLLVMAGGALLLSGWSGAARAAKCRREEEDARALLFGEMSDDGFALPDDNEEPEPLEWDKYDPGALASRWGDRLPEDDVESDQFDGLCDDVFSSSHDFGNSPDRWTGRSDNAAICLAPAPSRTNLVAARLRAIPLQHARPGQATAAAPQPRGCKRSGSQSLGSQAVTWRLALALSGLLCLLAAPWRGPTTWDSSMAGKTIATAPRAVTKSIEDLRVGDWVLADNPQLTARERAEAKEAQRPQDDPSRWRRISMRLHKESGGHVDIELLRPLAWLETHQVAIGEKVNLELTELAVAGWADVFRIDACPPIGPPPSPGCRVVTGHYAHSATSTLDLRIAGISGQPGQTIGVTATHPIWSVEEDDFVAAGDLLVGEQLLTADGLITSVLEIAPRPGEELVFNLEVDVEHVYFVSPAGLLVHNATVLCHAGSKLSTKPNHVYEIRDKLTGQVYKYGISSGKIGLNGQSYRATRQVNALNRAAGYNRYESRIIGRNLTRSKALSMEQGRVNGYSVARQRAGATNRQGPVGNKLPQPTR